MILFVAGAHVDVTAKLLQNPVMGSSNPVDLITTPGGASLNMARNSAMLGETTHLLSAIGADDYGSTVRNATTEAGITSHLAVVENAATGSFTAIIKPDGEQLIGLADLAIYEHMTSGWIAVNGGKAMKDANAVIINSNLSTGVLMELAQTKPPSQQLYGATISPAKAERLKPVLPYLDCLFTNVAEAGPLLGAKLDNAKEAASRFATLSRLGNGPKSGIISHQGNPAWWWDGGRTGGYAFEAPWMIADVTGGGDALAGTMIAALARGMTVEDALPLGLAAARLTIETKGAVCETLSWAAIDEIMPAMAINAQTEQTQANRRIP